jgi:predicted anti-sigma-YlaC factor YlaD
MSSEPIDDDDIDCRAASHLLSAEQDGPLPPDDVRQLAAHLPVCQMCRHVQGQLALLRLSVRELGSGDD